MPVRALTLAAWFNRLPIDVNQRGTGTVDRDIDTLRYLEAQYDHQQANSGEAQHLDELLGDYAREEDADYWRSILDSLTSAGMILNASGMGGLAGLSGFLKAPGMEHVENIRRQREDPTARRRAAPTVLLHWIDKRDHGSASWMQLFGAYDTIPYLGGRMFTQMEILAAAKRLVENGLVEGKDKIAEIDGPLFVRITSDGQDCVESGREVAEYIASNRRPQPTVQYNLSGNFHSNNISAGGTDFTQTLSASGAPSDDIRVLMDAVLESIDRLGLSDLQVEEVRRSAEQVKSEVARPEPDEGMVRTLLGRVGDGVKEGTAKATAATLTFVIDFWLTRMGVPPVS